MIVEAFIQAVIYTTTAIATLRAGSRAIYAYKHDNEIGVMDGPLILSPQDIARLREQGSMEGEISPLWESVHGFTEAVRLLYDEAQFTDDVVVGNWKKEEETSSFYSMASPHKSYQEKLVEKKKDDLGQNNETQSQPTVNETSLVIVEPKEINQWRGPIAFSLIQNYISTIKTLCWEVWDCHPLLGKKQFFSGNYEEEEEIDDDDLDLDLFYAKTIDMPKSAVDDDLFSDSLDSEKQTDRVAHIKAFAPNTFAKLRTRFGINEEQFLSSLARGGPNVSFQSNSKGAARVGGFFFFSRDGAYMVKTIKVSLWNVFLGLYLLPAKPS
jgi:hypothetical protein